jgi:RND family efflux transporter MFP subunit
MLTGCGQEEEKKPEVIRPVKIFHITTAASGSMRSFPGKVDASEKADLSFRVPGKIIEFPIKEGDKLKKGELIAKLDPKDYQIALDGAKSQAEYAKVQLERYAKQLEEKFISQSKYDQKKTENDVAQSNLDTATKNLEYTQLQAPFDGEIAARYVENFQTVKEKEPIVRLHNRTNIDVTVQIPESVIIKAKGKTNNSMEAEFDSVPGKRYPAQIKEISSQPDPDTQTYKVTLTLPAPEKLNILPGMTATIYVHFNFAEGPNKTVFMVPTSAIFADEKGVSSVWIIDPTTQAVTKRNVKMGQLEGENTPITEGLATGDTIVSAGVKFLREGMKVRPLEKTAAAQSYWPGHSVNIQIVRQILGRASTGAERIYHTRAPERRPDEVDGVLDGYLRKERHQWI